jgi:exonuclease SbcD
LVRLTDRKALLDPMGRLRAVYPNVLHIERPALEQARPTALAGGDTTLGDRELFAAFFEEVTGEALAAEQEKTFLEVYEDLQRREREADA